MRRWARRTLWVFGSLAALVVALVVAALLVLQSQWLRDRVRERIVYEIENATGARVELGAFLFDWRNLTAEVRNLVLHGKEGPGEPPLFRADSVHVGLRIVSFTRKQVDLYSAVVRRPQANIIVYADGSTNFPTPKRVSERKREPVQTVLNLAIKRFNVTDGSVQFAMRRLPLNVAGEDLRALILYDAHPVQRYRGDVSFRHLGVKFGERKPLPLDVNGRFALARNSVEISSLHLGLNRSSVDLQGRVENFAAPRAKVQYALRLFLEDIVPALGVRLPTRRGLVDLGGEATVSGRSQYALAGQLKAAGLAFEQAGVRISNISVASAVAITPGRIELPDMIVRALGGHMDGRFEMLHFRDLRVDGAVHGFSIQELTHVEGIPHADWNGILSGPVAVTGAIRNGRLAGFKVNANLALAPAPGPNPVEGQVQVAYDRDSRQIDFGQSRIATRFSRVQFSGALGRQLNVTLDSTDLNDLEPAIKLGAGRPVELPVRLQPNGTAKFAGAVTGPIKNPSVRGRGALTNFVFENRTIDSLAADVNVSRSGVAARNIDARKAGMRATGWFQTGLRGWKADRREPISGAVAVRAPDLAALLAEAGRKLSVTGAQVAADLNIGGTIGAPLVNGRVSAAKVVAYGQPFDRVEGQVRYTEGLVQVSPATVQIGGSEVRVAGSYSYKAPDFDQGRLRFEAATKGIPFSRIQLIQERSPGLAGRIDTQLAGDITLEKSGFRINAVDGWLGVRGLVFEKERLGSLLLSADTKGAAAAVRLAGELAGAKVSGRSEWTLANDYPVRGRLDFTRINFATLIERFRNMPAAAGLPFDGYAAGHLDFAGATTRPETFKANAEIAELEVRPKAGTAGLANAEEMVIRNVGPIRVELDSKVARIQDAVLRGKETDLTVGGRVTFAAKNPLDLRARGQMNLALLHDLVPRLESAGAVLLDISARGKFARPEIYGRIDLHKGAFNWPGLPNGIDNVEALIFLYRDRATIDRLTAESGGGKVNVTGFVGFATALTFHLQARGEEVRVRYPEGVSSTANAALTLTGTPTGSLLSGEVTVTRVGFNPRSDLASILAATAEPKAAPATPNAFLQGLRLDVHVVTAPQARLETKLTRDIQADADLRLRGTATRPILLGRVVVNEGEVVFFGQQYDIQSGQVLFVNASKIEPIVNLDLQTRARGIDVNLHVAGPVNKLNMTYRSDPPLQFSEIVALLATGREPAGAGVSGASQTQAAQQSWQQAGASALLTQALANPVAGRLQRFFGVSRLKIDPQLSGVTTNNAAARVTLEQQIARNITLTYITDVSRPQAQTIRIEVDLTRSWSAVALREENGLFGIDVLYKKQFK